MKESIFFLSSFFYKRIIYLVNYNNYITTILNLVQAFEFPKNDLIFSEIKQDFKYFQKLEKAYSTTKFIRRNFGSK